MHCGRASPPDLGFQSDNARKLRSPDSSGEYAKSHRLSGHFKEPLFDLQMEISAIKRLQDHLDPDHSRKQQG